ncbi:unnamed protein product [Adineta ricciae]|uniref:N-acetylgalactosaminide beta-1,3-galactosyltransferase n=1 Tax=Adineta ricciae TaxID=249248 RepID=A0A814J044_ADIRI|nr:unnamed protein product [Adineta ricciae]
MRKDQSTNEFEFDLYDDYSDTHSFTTRICCFILTAPKYFLTRAKAINETWAPRCDRYFFVSEYMEDMMTSEQLNITRHLPIAPLKELNVGYSHLTQKSTLSFIHAYENYLNDYEWFVKADDDTYMVVENLKTFLSEQNASEPITFGYNFKVNMSVHFILVSKGYHSGGAAYVLSREAVRRFYEAHRNSDPKCRKDGGAEDVEIAKCLRKTGVYPGRSLDKQNRELFHPLPFVDHFYGSVPNWLEKNAENPLKIYYDCCGDQTISFHYIPPEGQYLMDFLIYST